MMNHAFTTKILRVLEQRFSAELAPKLFEASPLLQYLNIKTRAAERGSKSRASFANHYALYVLIEDYIKKGYADKRIGQYSKYKGARFSDLLQRQRELPFGAKLQNHALNSRLNDEFSKYFRSLDERPILRQEQRYWVNESLLEVRLTVGNRERTFNLAHAIIDIIDEYIATKKAAFESFIDACRAIAAVSAESAEGAIMFVEEQLQPNVDARIFEIVSYAVLKAYYGEKSIFWGWAPSELHQEFLMLYKTGRTNANDGGIDFVMRPLGRFFQVTETIDSGKYFLDIDKIMRYPLTFVVKTHKSQEEVLAELREQAVRRYRVEVIVERYLQSVEEVINIPRLLELFREVVQAGHLNNVMDEIISQSKVEFNDEDYSQ